MCVCVNMNVCMCVFICVCAVSPVEELQQVVVTMALGEVGRGAALLVGEREGL